MLFSHLLALSSFGLALASPLIKRSGKVAFDFGGNTKVRGVSIGGWLVLEPFITPSIFQPLPDNVVDEYTLGQTLEHDDALKILKQHWDTWVSADDFNRIAAQGFNTVRIPIGYWAYQNFDSPYITANQDEYLEKAIGWARDAGLFVWIDLHGAPLSQNGFDNSGERLTGPGWLGGDSRAQTLQVLDQMSSKYAAESYNDVVVAIELLNEPLVQSLGGGQDAVKSFYRDGFNQLRQYSPDVNTMLHDGFLAPSAWNNFLTPSDNNAQNVVLDHHYYQIFNNDYVAWSPQTHIDNVCGEGSAFSSGRDKWLVVGEFTAAFDDCALWLNGRGIGARYDGSKPDSPYIGDCNARNNSAIWSDDMKQKTRAYLERQISAFEQQTIGWVFWNFKTESATAWSAFGLDDLKLLPQPLDQKLYGDVICS